MAPLGPVAPLGTRAKDITLGVVRNRLPHTPQAMTLGSASREIKRCPRAVRCVIICKRYTRGALAAGLARLSAEEYLVSAWLLSA